MLDTERTTMKVIYESATPLTYKVYLAKYLGIRFEAGAHGELVVEGVEDAVKPAIETPRPSSTTC